MRILSPWYKRFLIKLTFGKLDGVFLLKNIWSYFDFQVNLESSFASCCSLIFLFLLCCLVGKVPLFIIFLFTLDQFISIN